MQTTTNIPPGGGLEIVVPAGFVIDPEPELLKIRNPAAVPPPNGLKCVTYFDQLLGVDGLQVLRCSVDEKDGLPAGVVSFAMLMENPRTTIVNYPFAGSGPDACGTFICWTMNSFEFLANVTHASSGKLDYGTSAQGFDITGKMLEARIPTISEEQRRATGRDDRPLQPNSIIFAFKLLYDSTQSGKMIVRGPYGFVFSQQCLPFIEVSESKTFGSGIRFPEAFSVWPVGIRIASCLGTGREAVLELVYGPGAKFVNNMLYIFRIGIQSNPLLTPSANRWTIQVAGEASEPMEGMTLWAFTGTAIHPISTARDRTMAGRARTPNPLKFHLTPFNTIAMDGEFRAEAPSGFQFKHLPSRVCTAELQELPYVSLGIYYPGFVWPEQDLVCLVAVGNSAKLSVKLKNKRPVMAGLKYVLVLTVYNPSVIVGPTIPTWRISSYSDKGLSLDESWIPGFRLNTVMNLWNYRNPDPTKPDRPNTEVVNGGARLPAFSLQLRFPTVLLAGDEILIISPQDFDLNDNQGNCRGLQWIDPTADGAVTDFNPLPNSQVKCNSSSIMIYINEPQQVPRDTHLEFGLEIFNPLRTPVPTDNFWRATLFGPGFESDGKRTIKSSKAFEGWKIIPQLENLTVQIVGANTAAGSVSDISFAFTPVNDAEDMAIEFNSPIGFSFDGAETANPLEQVVFIRKGPLIRIKMEIKTGIRRHVVVRNVRMGSGGGQTDITITTWVGGLMQGGSWHPGTKQDERMNYRSGFRLPGQVEIRYEKLENIYHMDSLTYPEQSLWSSQMGRPAFAEFHFYLSVRAEAGHFLKISAKPYMPTMAEFTLVESPVGSSLAVNTSGQTVKTPVRNEITSIFGGKIETRLLEPLIPFRRYEVRLSIISPSAVAVKAHGGRVRWFIETWDGGKLPTNTNDGNSREFPIVEEYTFNVEAERSPPLAEIQVSLSVQPALRPVTALRVVAPLLFNFSRDCLAHGAGFIVGCQPQQNTPSGRATAVLKVREPFGSFKGIVGMVRGIRIKVDTPAVTPVNKAWYVEGVDAITDIQQGWGEAEGIPILAMQDTSVTYPGFAGVTSRMVWRFRTRQLVEAGGYLDITVPNGIFPQCDKKTLSAIALPKEVDCKVVAPQRVHVYLNSTIVPSEYVLGFPVTPPTSNPFRNELSILLKDKDGFVKDASVKMPGTRILEKIRLKESPMLWTSTKANRLSTITIGFDALESLPDLIVAPDQQIDEILITLPKGFIHQVQKLTDFQIMNEDMPLRKNDWLDFYQKDRLRISMELNVSGTWTTLKTGYYGFRFDVMVPSPLPAFNVWHLSVCSPNFPEGCSKITDPAVMGTFAIPGFKLDDPVNGMSLTSAAKRGSTGFTSHFVWLLLTVVLTAGLSFNN
eukprot:TRINITY_DN27621_c0_g1_i2.p1 TRINITY_DN27621_c0_g1~~TRINITY_DN27621_c0_g1_i2.p1  ORF type:complete len:1376 (+),score=242.81 TRINITY_DN27621_c0_g1_i2:170-4297(+)